MLFTWNRWFAKQKSTVRKPRRRPRVQLAVEQLETRLAPAAASWQPVGPAPITGLSSDGGTVTGRITSIAVDPNDSTGNTVYVGGAGGGVWEGQNLQTDSMRRWIDLTANLAALTGDPFINSNVGALAAVAGTGTQTGDTIIYVGLGEANASTDLMTPGAATSVFYGAGMVKLVVNPSTASVVSATLLGSGTGQSNQFYGMAFSKIVVATTGSIYAAVSASKNGVTGNEGIYKSTNGGVSWTNTTNTTIPAPGGNPTGGIAGSQNDEFSDLVIDPSNPQVLYAAIGEAIGSPQNGVYVTTNGGVSWSEMQGTAGGILPSGVGVGRITLALSGNIGSSTPEYELYAAFITTALTQNANITSSPTSGKVYFSGGTGPQFQKGEAVYIQGVGSQSILNFTTDHQGNVQPRLHNGGELHLHTNHGWNRRRPTRDRDGDRDLGPQLPVPTGLHGCHRQQQRHRRKIQYHPRF